jgi:hypothetical protein
MAHIDCASSKMRFPMFGFRLSFMTKSILTPSKSLKVFSKATKRNKVGTSLNVTNKSKSLSALSSPRTNEPNTSNVLTRYCALNDGSIPRSFTKSSSRLFADAFIVLIIQDVADTDPPDLRGYFFRDENHLTIPAIRQMIATHPKIPISRPGMRAAAFVVGCSSISLSTHSAAHSPGHRSGRHTLAWSVPRKAARADRHQSAA